MQPRQVNNPPGIAPKNAPAARLNDDVGTTAVTVVAMIKNTIRNACEPWSRDASQSKSVLGMKSNISWNTTTEANTSDPHVWLRGKVVAPEGRRLRVPSSVACLSLNLYVPEGPTGGKGVLSGPKKESPEGRHVNRCSIALARRMGTQAENESVGDSFGRSGDTVTHVLDHFAKSVVTEFRDEFIRLPDPRMHRSYGWQALGDMHAFKEFHDNLSLTLLAIVNARYELWWVSDIYPGATHDSRIWRASNLASLVAEGVFPPNDAAFSLLFQLIRFFVVGDSAFAGTDFVLKPMTAAQAPKISGVFYKAKRLD